MLQFLEGFRVMILARYVSKSLRKFLAQVIVIRAGVREFLYGIDRRLLERLVSHRRPCEPDDGESPRQTILRCQAVQGRDQLPSRKITRRAKDNDGARVRRRNGTPLCGCNGFGNTLFSWRHFRVLISLLPS